MDREHLRTLIRAEIELPALEEIRRDVAFGLPKKGYPLTDGEAWSMAGLLMEDYIVHHFDSTADMWRYIAETGDALAGDVIGATPVHGSYR